MMSSPALAEPPAQTAISEHEEQHSRSVKRARVSPEPGGGEGGDGAGASGTSREAEAGAGGTQEQQQQQQQQHGHDNHKRQHGHGGHLRTHHVVDEPEELGGGGSGRGRHGGAAGSKDVAPKANGGAKLSFADELEEGGSGADDKAHANSGASGGGGLRAATEDRFREEKRAARHASAHHAFHHRARADNGHPDAAAAGVAVVDEDATDGAGANVGLPGGPLARAPTLGRVHFGSASARGLRPYMEDRHCVVASMQLLSGTDGNAPLPSDGIPRSYAAIFDGHNGAGCAELAAARLHMLLAAHPALRIHTGEPGPPAVVRAEEAAISGALRSAFGAVDEATLAVARREGVRDGATALVLLRLGQVLYAAHAGDSRAVLCRDGSALRLTEDHKPHLPRERARIEDAGGRVDFQRCWRVVVEPRDGRPGSGLAVSRSLGDLDFKEPNKFVECEPDVLRVQLRPLQPSGTGDAFVILGSDGLWDVLSDEDAVHTAKRALQAYKAEHGRSNGDGEAKAAAEALLEESLRRGTADNVTAVFMLLAWS